MNAKIMVGLLFSAAVVSSGCTRTVVVERPVGIPDAGMGAGAYGSGTGENAAGGGSSRNGGGRGGMGNGRGGRGGNGAGGGQYGAGNGAGGQYGANGGGTGGGQYGNGAYGSGQYTPADLRNPSSILAQRIIYFDYDQSGIRPEFQQILNAHAALLAAYPNLNIRLEGHADERGSREYNIALSERRGYSVLDYMKAKGAHPQQAEVVGYGEEVPAAFGHNESAWNKNRRVEIIYSGE